MRKYLGVLVIVAVLTLFTGAVHAEKLATLNEILKPDYLAVDKEQIYVVQGAEVFIYSLKDYKLITKFGKAGEGPQEFKINPFNPLASVLVFPYQDELVINSLGRVSTFSKKGEFIREMSTKDPMLSYVRPIGDGYIGMKTTAGAQFKNMTQAVALYDKDFNKKKDVYALQAMKDGKSVQPQVNTFFQLTSGKIVLSGEDEFVVNIYNSSGEKISSIKRDYKRLKLTDEFKKRYFKILEEAFKNLPPTFFEQYKKSIFFKDYFPAVQFAYAADNTVYILTYDENDDMVETFVYDINGKFLKRTMLPLSFKGLRYVFLRYIKNNHLYQFIENEEEETWELHGMKIL